MGGTGKVEKGADLFLVYLQVCSLPQLTLSSSGSSEDILKGNSFLILFWRKSSKGDLLYKVQSSVSQSMLQATLTREDVGKGVCDQLYLRHRAYIFYFLEIYKAYHKSKGSDKSCSKYTGPPLFIQCFQIYVSRVFLLIYFPDHICV